MKNSVLTILPEPAVFLGKDVPQKISIVWDKGHEILIRRQPPFLKNQAELRGYVLDLQDHSACVVETVPPGEWPNLDLPGHIGRVARLAYTAFRKMDAETFLRIIAKLPRRPRLSESGAAEIARIARSVAADPILRTTLVPGRFQK